MPFLFVFCGYRGSGKDTLARYLIQNYNFTRFAFADPVKDYTSKMLGIDRDAFYNVNRKDKLLPGYNRTPRDLCIFVGQTIKGAVSDSFWADKVAEQIQELWRFDPNRNIVVTDCRFPVEKHAMERLGGSLFWIHRHAKPPSLDITETSINLQDCKFFINNSGELNVAIERLKNVVKNL